jgi:hypothetical protein
MAVVAFTGKGVTPMPKVSFGDKPYLGTDKVAMGPQWSPPVDPFKSYADEKRRLEAIAQAEAAARQKSLTALAQQRMVDTSTIQGVNRASGFPQVQPLITPNAPDIFNIPETPQDWMNSSGLDLTPASETNLNLVSGTGALKGPDRPGFVQEPIKNADGSITGYRYVKISDASKDLVNYDAPETNVMPFSADRAARSAGENVVDVLASNVLKDESFRNQLGLVRTQIYGEPTIEELPNGDERLVYNNELLLYHGITSDLQAAGYVAGRLPDPIDPNASDVEKYEYYKRGIFAPPLYKIGEEYTQLATMTRQEKIDLQKSLKRAGYYTEDFPIIPGILQSDEISFLQAAMGEANVAGLELDDLFQIRARKRDQLIAKRKSGGGGGGGAATRSVDIRFDTTTMANGRTLLSRVLQDALGRAPSDDELSRFMAMLNEAESKSPTKTITQYITSGNTRKSVSRTNPSDVDPESMAREFAQGIDGGAEMGEYQTNRFMSMLMQRVAGARNG